MSGCATSVLTEVTALTATEDEITYAQGDLSNCENFENIYYLVASNQLPIISINRGAQDAFDKARRKVCRCCRGGPDGEVLP